MVNINDFSIFKEQAYCNGQWLHGDSQSDVINPATGDVLGQVANLTVSDVKSTIDDAHSAFKLWSKTTAKERSVLLKKWYELIVIHTEELASILTLEMGKPLAESRGEIAYGASFIEWFSEEAKRVYGDVIPSFSSQQKSIVIKQPIGVVGAITPWNFPNAMITRKAGAALASGCTIVVKPAQNTPYSAIALAVLAEKAGIPKGVLNIVTTDDSKGVGIELCNNEKVKKITFTGSTPVGKILTSQCVGTMKKVSMELGGNAPSIVFSDADIDNAVTNILGSKFRNNGQTCVCTNRILVASEIKDIFVDKLKIAMKSLVVGNGMDSATTQGPLIDEKAMHSVDRLVQNAVNDGAEIITGGKTGDLGHAFYQPTILNNVTVDMKIFQEEIFGPIATIIQFDNEEEAIALANDTPFGLAGYFYSNDIARIWRVAEALECGMVGVNTGVISSETIPFGGVKESGNGREGSKYGLDDYLEVKFICLGNL